MPVTLEKHSLSFAEDLREEQTGQLDYDREKWLYLPCRDTDYRYVLGTKGQRPLICVGVNPSPPVPTGLDRTLQSVQRIAQANGFDSFVMVNLCTQRATSPEDLSAEPDEALHRENLKAIEWVLEQAGKHPAVWAAWGTPVDARGYLAGYLRDVVSLGQRFGVRWYTAGSPSKAKGHPHHPLYLGADSQLEPFADIQQYIDNL